MGDLGTSALWVLVALPAAAGVALSTAGRRADRIAAPLSVGAAILVVASAFVVAVDRPRIDLPFMAGARFGLAVDGLSSVIVPTVAIVTLIVLVFAASAGTAPAARFHGLMLVFAAAVAVTATATTLPVLLFAWEIMGALSYALIGFHWRDDERVSSGLTAFLTTRLGDLGLYVAAGAALAGGAGSNLADLTAATTPWLHIIAAGILLAAFGKAAQVPFSFWLSRAMQGPSTVSALLHSAAMVAMGGYLLLRLASLLAATGWAGQVAAWVGAITAALMGIVALAQRDLKQLLAASTAAQLGFVVLAAGVGATAGGAAHLIAHAATKSLLFLAAGAWLSALGTKELAALRGAGRRWPVVGIAFAIGALSLAGVAPLALWATKDDVLAGVLAADPVLYVIGVIASALSAAYAGKALVMIWRPVLSSPESGYDTELRGSRQVNAWQQVPLAVLAAGAAFSGALALPPVGDWLRNLLGAESQPLPAVASLIVSGLLALAVVGVMAWCRVPTPTWAASWLGLERAAHAVTVTPVLRLAAALARFDDVLDHCVHRAAHAVARDAQRLAGFDDRVLDGSVTATARGANSLAAAGTQAEVGGVDRLVGTIARATGRLGALARRPQTGQVHQYFAQITVVLALCVIFLLIVVSV